MNILILSAHPDDEALGCSGSIFRHKSQRDTLFWCVVTEAWKPAWSLEKIKEKNQEIEKAAAFYGVEKLFHLKQPAMKLDTLPKNQLIDSFRDMISEIQPEWIYGVHGGDIHSDHRVVFETMMSACKPFHSGSVRKILCYETLSSTEQVPPLMSQAFLPNVYVDVSPFIDQKLEALELYKSELQRFPSPRSTDTLKALARLRGATINVPYAEAFILMRERIL